MNSDWCEPNLSEIFTSVDVNLQFKHNGICLTGYKLLKVSLKFRGLGFEPHCVLTHFKFA